MIRFLVLSRMGDAHRGVGFKNLEGLSVLLMRKAFNLSGLRWMFIFIMPLIFWLTLALPAHADVIYTVEEGDSAWSIAIEFGVSLEDLYAANGWALDENPMLRIGQRIAIPSDRDEDSSGDSESGDDSETTTETTYIVQPGDNPYMIAHRFGIGTLVLLEFNHLTEDDLIQPGQMLSIPPSSYEYQGNAESVGDNENTSGPAPEPLRYRVQPGDSPWTIARQFGINVQTVLSFNNLTEGALLHIGDELLIPADFGTLQSRSSTWERYTVVSGDTLSEIASRNAISLAALIEANNLSAQSLLREGTELVIPAYRSAPIIETQPPEIVPPAPVVPDPPRDYSQELTPLQPLNPIEPIDECDDLEGWHSEIFDFSQITPPELATPDPSPVTDDSLSRDGTFDDGIPYHIYTVRRGDTISEVAHAFGITQSELMNRNGLDMRTSLRIGRDLRIPLPRPPAPPPSSGGSGSSNNVDYGAPNVPIGDGSGTASGQAVIQEASKYLGTPYVWSGTSLTGGVDCSGYTMQVYAMFGVSLPHRAAEQAQCGVAVDYSNLQTGDLVLFHTTRSGISHVGMYIGNGDFIHSSSHMGGVVISPLDSGYYNERFVCARRVL